jgi:hypothetical protein
MLSSARVYAEDPAQKTPGDGTLALWRKRRLARARWMLASARAMLSDLSHPMVRRLARTEPTGLRWYRWSVRWQTAFLRRACLRSSAVLLHPAFVAGETTAAAEPGGPQRRLPRTRGCPALR